MANRARLLSSVAEQSTEGMAVVDLEGNLLFVNAAFARMHGYSPDELLGKNLSVFHTPEQLPSVEAASREIRGTGEFSGEIWHVRRDGTVFPTIMHNSLLRDKTGSAIGMIGTVRDITERKEVEQALRRREAVLSAMVHATGQLLKSVADWERGTRELLRRVGEASNVSRVYIFENETLEDGELVTSQRFEWVAEDVTPQIGNPDLQRLPFKRAGVERWVEIMENGGAVRGLVRDFPESEQTILAPQGILSIAVVPIRLEHGWWGFIGFDDCVSERQWSDVELDALRAVADTLGAHIERSRAERELQRSEKRFRRLVESLEQDYIIYSHDMEGIFTYLSPSIFNVLGYTREEFMGHYTEYMTDSPINKDVEAITDAGLRGEKQVTYESEFWHKDRSRRLLEVTETPVFDDEGNVEGIEGIVHDITERKKTERELAQHREHLEELVRERTEELESANDALRKRATELEIFTGATIGREKQMIKLKKEVNELLDATGQPPKYRVYE